MLSEMKAAFLRGIFERHMRWRLDELIRPSYAVVLEYPIHPAPRYGDGKPPHPELWELFAKDDNAFLGRLNDMSRHRDALAAIPFETSRPEMPCWGNSFFSALDAICLYGLLGSRKPSVFLEVGSGNSTKFARKAINDLGLTTRIISIDPAPRAEVDALCDQIIRQPLEAADISILADLGAGDILFVDNSHRVFTNSDCSVFFLEILPRLKPGVMVHVHDIFLPFDYPGIWSKRHYSEQYLLASYLLAGCAWLKTLLPLAYLGKHPKGMRLIGETWQVDPFQSAFESYRRLTGGYVGTSFWMEVLSKGAGA